MIKEKEGVNVDNMDKVYNHMRFCVEKYGCFHSTIQMARELDLNAHEVTEAVEKLEEAGKIKITQIPRETIIEFAK